MNLWRAIVKLLKIFVRVQGLTLWIKLDWLIQRDCRAEIETHFHYAELFQITLEG